MIKFCFQLKIWTAFVHVIESLFSVEDLDGEEDDDDDDGKCQIVLV